MNIKENKTIDMLNKESVSILTQKFIELDGVKTQAGKNHRCAYSNSVYGRERLQTEQPEDVVNAVLAIWGDDPTITEGNPEEPDETENVSDELA